MIKKLSREDTFKLLFLMTRLQISHDAVQQATAAMKKHADNLGFDPKIHGIAANDDTEEFGTIMTAGTDKPFQFPEATLPMRDNDANDTK